MAEFPVVRTEEQYLHRGRWVAVVAALILLVAGLAALGYTTLSETHQLQASCRFYRDIATLAVSASPPTSPIGVNLVIDARRAYTGQDCTPVLPSPSLPLQELAARYGISLT